MPTSLRLSQNTTSAYVGAVCSTVFKRLAIWPRDAMSLLASSARAEHASSLAVQISMFKHSLCRHRDPHLSVSRSLRLCRCFVIVPVCSDLGTCYCLKDIPRGRLRPSLMARFTSGVIWICESKRTICRRRASASIPRFCLDCSWPSPDV